MHAGDIETTPDALAALAAWPVNIDRPWVRANMVTTLDGAVAGPTGTSRSISSPEDHALLLLLRRTCEVILIGASTARREGYRRPSVPLAIISRSLTGLVQVPALGADAGTGRPRPLIVTCAASDPRMRAELESHADVLVCGQDDVDLQLAVVALADRGLHRIHCEGGPAVLGGLIAADLLDELFLTLSPILLGAPSTLHLVDLPGFTPRTTAFTSVHTSGGSVFLRMSMREQ